MSEPSEHETDDFIDALIAALLSDADIVYWNREQKEWDKVDDPKIPGMEFRPYCWSEGPESEKPNLKFDFSPQEIRWYKYPGRGQSCTMLWDEKEWRQWFDAGMELINKYGSTVLYGDQ